VNDQQPNQAHSQQILEDERVKRGLGAMRRMQFTLFTFYEDLSVQKLARSFGNFLKLYHQSLSALV
jgi:hypothetical protein